MEEVFKVCSTCKQNKNLIGNFTKKTRAKDGFQNICIECSAIHSRKHYVKHTVAVKANSIARRKRILPIGQEMILSRLREGCIDCPEKDPVVLEFDHLKDKKFQIASWLRGVGSLDKLETELSKCVVRCANCHRRKTAKDFNWWKVSISE